MLPNSHFSGPKNIRQFLSAGINTLKDERFKNPKYEVNLAVMSYLVFCYNECGGIVLNIKCRIYKRVPFVRASKIKVCCVIVGTIL